MTETLLEQARAIVAPLVASVTQPEAHRLDATLEASQLVGAAAALHAARWGFLTAITGLDHGAEAGRIEVLYHFCSGRVIVTLRVQLERDSPTVPTITPWFPAAVVGERELAEMFGVTVTDLPDPSHLFLPDGWPDGMYPLRKAVCLPRELEAPDDDHERN